jgi:hypothetical protein
VNLDDINVSSTTASGCGFKVRSARNASIFGSCPDAAISTSESHECKYHYADMSGE